MLSDKLLTLITLSFVFKIGAMQNQPAQEQISLPDTTSKSILDLPCPVLDNEIAPLLTLQELGRLRQTCKGLCKVWDHSRTLHFIHHPVHSIGKFGAFGEKEFSTRLLERLYNSRPPEKTLTQCYNAIIRLWSFKFAYSIKQANAASALSDSGNYTLVNGLRELHRLDQLGFRNKIKLTLIDVDDDHEIYSLPAEIQQVRQLKILEWIAMGMVHHEEGAIKSIIKYLPNLEEVRLSINLLSFKYVDELRQALPRTKIMSQNGFYEQARMSAL